VAAVLGGAALVTMTPSGDDVAVIKQVPFLWAPSWAPDGTRLAYQLRHRTDPSWNVSLIAPDGTGKSPLVRDERRHEGMPTWSGDGGRIAFVRWTARSDADLFAVSATGTGLSRLTRTPAIDEWEPAWQPA
jgi:Tol biopolymer transport system component